MNFLAVLVKKGLLAEQDIASIEEEAASSGVTLEQILIKRGIAPKDILLAKGEFLEIPTRDITEKDIDRDTLEYIPEESATYYQFVPLSVVEGVLEVGMVDPDNIEARDALNFISSKIGMPYKIFLISSEDFAMAVSQYKGLSGEVTKVLSELETELDQQKIKEKDTSKEDEAAALDDSIAGSIEVKGKSGETRIVEDAPITKMVATIVRYAIDGNASDIHIEHTGANVKVRFRVDGVMNTSLLLPAKVHSAVVARIKIQSGLRLDEKRKPQDGRFGAQIDGRKVDFRVSTFPAYYGEKVVMRILDQSRGIKTLDDLGLSPENLKKIRDAIKRPYGLVLISGPTGSGKSTTLYSMLQEVDREHKNVLSLEDPIEYNIDGVSQSQVKPDIGYTFASGLRTTLRQDPDIIMVGEIRDKETAQLAIQASLTGHLVLSTIHTNNAVGVIPRLIDMGVDPYLIPPTLVIAIAQRLVRTLCPGGGEPVPVEGVMKTMIEKQFSDLPESVRSSVTLGKEFYKIKATDECPNGTRGRIAVMEVLEMDKDIERLVLEGKGELDIYKTVREKGMLTMKEDAIMKAFSRIIPFEDIATV